MVEPSTGGQLLPHTQVKGVCRDQAIVVYDHIECEETVGSREVVRRKEKACHGNLKIGLLRMVKTNRWITLQIHLLGMIGIYLISPNRGIVPNGPAHLISKWQTIG